MTDDANPHGIPRPPIPSLFTVYVRTEGLDLCPILCAAGQQATQLVEDLAAARIITDAALLPCCRNDNDACARDHWHPDETDRPTEILMRAAIASGIPWPSDAGRIEPEYSVLPHADR